MLKIRSKVKEKKVRAFWSDESDSEEDVPDIPLTREADMDEYLYAKAQRKKAKQDIIKFVKEFRAANNGKNPTDEDTAPIAMELADYNHCNQNYIDIKLALIKADNMPF